MNTLTEGFQEIYFRILNFLVGGRWAMGVWKNLVSILNFHGAEGMARASGKGRGEGKSLQEIYFGILARSLGPGTTGRGGGWSGKFIFQF